MAKFKAFTSLLTLFGLKYTRLYASIYCTVLFAVVSKMPSNLMYREHPRAYF